MEKFKNEKNISTNINKFTSLIKEEIRYPNLMTSIKNLPGINLLTAGDEKGKITFFDIRVSKPVKLINTNASMDIKYDII